MELTGVRGHSPDLEWWWEAGAWRPAWSADRLWWFDGAAWTPQNQARPRRSPLPPLVVIGSAGWLALWLASSVLSVVLVQNQGTAESGDGTVLAGLLTMTGCWLAGMIAWGYLLTRSGFARLLPLAIACVTALLLALYVVSMSFSPDQGADIAAGVGLVMGAVPALILVGLLTGLGAGIGHLRRRRALP